MILIDKRSNCTADTIDFEPARLLVGVFFDSCHRDRSGMCKLSGHGWISSCDYLYVRINLTHPPRGGGGGGGGGGKGKRKKREK